MNTRADIIEEAKKEATSYFANVQQQYSEKQKLALTCRILSRYGHTYSDLLAGQVTARHKTRNNELHMWTQPFGMSLNEIKASDFLLLNRQLKVVSGDKIPNKANNFQSLACRA
ncbi:MAG TPA: hypothetical protein EYO59_10535 [Chromatiaceae bacterium]|nr:hypothetical protein [Chromatiaceae bacterium]